MNTVPANETACHKLGSSKTVLFEKNEPLANAIDFTRSLAQKSKSPVEFTHKGVTVLVRKYHSTLDVYNKLTRMINYINWSYS